GQRAVAGPVPAGGGGGLAPAPGPAGPPLSPALARLGAEAALHQGDRPRAAELARLAVPDDARDYRDHLWLAGVLESAGRRAEAGHQLERLVAWSGDIADPWVALLRHL